MPAKKAPAKKTSTRRSAPAKKSVAKKSATARASAAARTPKNVSYENLWEDELTSQYPAMKKNNFLSLIVLGLGTLLVVVGIYIQISKDEPQSTDLTTVATTGTNNTGNTSVTGENNISTPATWNQNPNNFALDAQRVVETFYGYFNQEQFDRIPELYDANFTNVPNLRQYFGPNRLRNRKPNIVGDMRISEVNAVIDHPIVQRNPNAMVVQYKTDYLLKQDGKIYTETWFAYVVRYNDGNKLNGFECQENCAASPFFQIR